MASLERQALERAVQTLVVLGLPKLGAKNGADS